MRVFIKGFVAISVAATSFLCGFTADTLKEAPRNLPAAQWRLATLPTAALAGLLTPKPAHADDTDLPPSETYEAVLNIIRNHYYSGNSPADQNRRSVTKLTYAAIDGMLLSLNDRYTEFITPREYKEMLQEQSGNFVGIGTTLDLNRDRRIIVVEPIEGSPAAKAGMLPGDILSAIDGKSITGLGIDDVIARIRGEEGTPVRVTVERRGKPLTFTMRRAVVNSPLVRWRMEDEAGKIGYIRLDNFYEQADSQFDQAVSRLEKQGMKALIFDLRDNPGGLLNMAQDIASRFLPEGPVVWVKEKNGALHSLDVDPTKHRGKLSTGAYPIVLLVNGGSASASEIVAGALQDGKVAALVGTRTYGKGLVQTIIPLNGDAAVKITTQHYFTRARHDINVRRDEEGHPLANTGGIIPDVVTDLTDADYARQREVIRNDPQNRAAINKLDPQLQKALEIVRAKLKN
ncbi:MAG: S41 family peptidase [Capsulimonadales bacterium]|nr:S41 family peptidase [Capsulimonadales bacterium]